MTPIHDITFAFNEAEDRIVLACTLTDQSRATMQLTRRMTGMVLAKLAEILMQTSNSAAALPSQMRDEVMLIEHARALAKVAEQVSTTPPAPVPGQGVEAPPLSGNLITRVDIHPDGERCSLLFFCDHRDSALTGLILNRAQLHWFADTADRYAQRGEWALPPFQRNWLAQRDAEAQVVPQAGMLH